MVSIIVADDDVRFLVVVVVVIATNVFDGKGVVDAVADSTMVSFSSSKCSPLSSASKA